jgi:hypothetical protein
MCPVESRECIMNESIDRRPSLPRFVIRIQNKGRTYYYFRRRPFPCIRLPEEPASPLFATAYNAALHASTREEFIALRAGMKTRQPDSPAVRALMAWADRQPITRAEAMLIAEWFRVSVEHITRNRELWTECKNRNTK